MNIRTNHILSVIHVLYRVQRLRFTLVIILKYFSIVNDYDNLFDMKHNFIFGFIEPR